MGISKCFDDKLVNEINLFFAEDETDEKMIFVKWNGELFALRRELKRVLHYAPRGCSRPGRTSRNALDDGEICIIGDKIYNQYVNLLNQIGRLTPNVLHHNRRQKMFAVVNLSNLDGFLAGKGHDEKTLNSRTRLMKYMESARVRGASIQCEQTKGHQDKRNIVGVKESLRKAVESAIADIDLKEKTMLSLMARIAALANENESYRERINKLEKDINEIKLNMSHARALNADDIKRKTQMFIDSLTANI